MRSLALGCLASVVAASSLVAGCSSGADANRNGSGADSTTSFSPIGTSIKDTLSASFPGELGGAWGWSTDNSLAGNWMLQMPLAQYWGSNEIPVATECKATDDSCDPDFLLTECATDDDCTGGGTCTPLNATIAHVGDAARSLCIGHSDAILDDIYDVVTHGTQRVDVSSLTPPDGRYLATLRNAVTFLSETSSPPLVRMVFGNYPGAFGSSNKVMTALTRDVDSSSGLQVSVGLYRDGLESWNHSKIVAADGKDAIEGGMNMWTAQYLQKDPVHDMSIRVKGSAAADAQRYTNRIWDFVCTDSSYVDDSMVATFGGTGATACLPDYPAATTREDNAGGSPVIAVGRLGAIGPEVSDTALVALIDASTSTLHIAQQDFGPPKKLGVSLAAWPVAIEDALVRAISRGVTVDLVLSNLGAVPGGLSSLQANYSNGWTPQDVAEHIIGEATANPDLWTSDEDMLTAMCERLHAVNAAASDDASWPDGGKLALHTKLVLADSKAFYLGSQNIYIANLAEFGFIVDDPKVATQMESDYYAKLWGYSSANESASCTWTAN